MANALRDKGAPSSVTVKGIATFEISDGLSAEGRAAGKTAIVTGAAQGFGLEIARDLAAQGPTVALADITVKGAETAAMAICDKHGDHRAIAVELNVTDSKSGRNMVDEDVTTLQ